MGLCYVKLPDSIHRSLINISAVARDYFHLDESEKKKQLRNTDGEGYTNHQDLRGEHMQRYIFQGNQPPMPLLTINDEMLMVSNFLEKNIAFPLLKQMLGFILLGEAFNSAMHNAKAALSLIYYPRCEEKSEIRLREHVDTVPLTLLFINENGLEAEIGGRWYPIVSKCGYIVINIGKALEIMTGGEYRA